MPDFILVTTLNGLQELYIVKPLLEEESINFYIKNENFIQMDPLYSVGTGGLDVMVVEDDAQRAYDILKDAGYIIEDGDVSPPENVKTQEDITPVAANEELTNCPFCHSDDIRKERSRRFMAILLLIGIPVPATSWIYRCFNCGKLFNKEGVERKYN
jgi:hypothetical protein